MTRGPRPVTRNRHPWLATGDLWPVTRDPSPVTRDLRIRLAGCWGVDELQNKLHIESSVTQNSNKLRCCFHHNCCISGPLNCHLSELRDPPIDWDEMMWEGRQTCLLQEFASKSSKPDFWLLFVAVFLLKVRVCRDTADRMSVSMAVSLDRWLDTRPPSDGDF